MENNLDISSSTSEAQESVFNRKLVKGCIVLVVVLISVCLLAVGGCIGFFVYFGREPENLSIDYSIPYSVGKGEQFDLVLTLTNTGDSEIFVGDIDLDMVLGESILDGSLVLSTDPPMERDYSIPGIKSFHYNRAIPAGETRLVTFNLQALEVGEYGGSIGAYVDGLAMTIDYVGITIIEE